MSILKQWINGVLYETDGKDNSADLESFVKIAVSSAKNEASNQAQRKYELVPTRQGICRVKALVSFGSVVAGELGGYVEKESNLSHQGECWISGFATVYGNAQVIDDALVSGMAKVYDQAIVSGRATVYGAARIFGRARVAGNARVHDNAWVFDNAFIAGAAEVYDEARIYNSLRVQGKEHIHSDLCKSHEAYKAFGGTSPLGVSKPLSGEEEEALKTVPIRNLPSRTQMVLREISNDLSLEEEDE